MNEYFYYAYVKIALTFRGGDNKYRVPYVLSRT